MKELIEFKQKRSSLIKQMEELNNRLMTENRGKDSEESKLWESYNKEVEELNAKIERCEKQEEINKRNVGTVVNTNEDTLSKRFYSALEAASKGQMTSFKANLSEFRAEPMLSNTIAQQNTQLGGISIIKQDAKSFLTSIGAKVYTGVKGQITLTSAASGNATFPGEGVADASLNLATATLTLAPRRISVNTKQTKEFIANVNDQIVNDVMVELEDAIWRRLATDLMYNFKLDAKDASTTIAGSTLTATDIYNLEAGVLATPKYPVFITSPKVAAYLKGTATISNVSGPIWTGNPYGGVIDGIPAYGTPYTGTTAVNGVGSTTSKELFYFDGNEVAIAQFGDLEITVNPFTHDSEGIIKIVASTLADTGVVNYRGVKWINDVSIA